MALTQQEISANILQKTAEYGKARSAFGQALAAAAASREQTMYGLGADFTTQTGKVLTPQQAGNLMVQDPQEFGKTKMTTGFSTQGTGLSGISQEQAATVYEGDVAAQEAGITTGSGIRSQRRLVTQDAGDVERLKLVQAAQEQVAAGEADVVAAKAAEAGAKAELQAARGMRRKPKGKRKQEKPQQKPVATNNQARSRAAKARADKKKKKGGK